MASISVVQRGNFGERDPTILFRNFVSFLIRLHMVDYTPTLEEVQQHFQSCGIVNRVTTLTDKSGQPDIYRGYDNSLLLGGVKCDLSIWSIRMEHLSSMEHLELNGALGAHGACDK